jgi:hypothetical protein
MKDQVISVLNQATIHILSLSYLQDITTQSILSKEWVDIFITFIESDFH